MTTIIINDNITAYVSTKTARAYEKELKAREAERKAREESLAESCRLYDFYEKYVATATESDYEIGYEIYKLGHEMWRTLPEDIKATAEGYVFGGKALDCYIAEFCKRNPEIDTETARRGFEASESYSYYSDWYKDVWGIRPH